MFMTERLCYIADQIIIYCVWYDAVAVTLNFISQILLHFKRFFEVNAYFV